jgi:Fe-S cluster assembly protein SufD
MLPLIIQETIEKYRLPNTNFLVVLDGVYHREFSQLPQEVKIEVIDNTIYITTNAGIINPIHLLFMASGNYQSSWHISVATDSNVTLFEEYISLGDTDHIVQIDGTMKIEKNSQLHHYRWGQAMARYIINTEIVQKHASKVERYFIQGEVGNFRETLSVKLAETEAAIAICGINFLRHDQIAKNKILVEHLQPGCTSNVMVKSILDNKGINDFDCKVKIYPGAVKSKAEVINRNLLLSDHATAKSSPELEIYNEDVICNHGATVGSPDQEVIFYLQSRGIVRDEAIKILTAAFANEVLELFPKYDRLYELRSKKIFSNL